MKVLKLPLSASRIEEVRAMAYDAVDEWVDTLIPFFEKEEGEVSLMELSEHFSKTRSQFFGACLKAAIEKLYRKELDRRQAPCPRCNRTLMCKRKDKKELSTLHGCCTIERPYFYCPVCKEGFHPLDELVDVAPEKHPYDIQAKSTQRAGRMPFGESAELFGSLTGIPVGEHFQHETVNALGHGLLRVSSVPAR